MITFETQEDFEDAVMKVLHTRLKLRVFMYDDFNKVKSCISLYDEKDRAEITQDEDYCEINIT